MKIYIKENFLRIKSEIPDYVRVVLAVKMKTLEEIKEVISAGAEIIGENYIQEAEKLYQQLGEKSKTLKWHMIGSLQKNKINKALRMFDCIQTIDSAEIATALSEKAERMGKIMSVFIEINIGSEITKAGVKPEYETIEKLAMYISKLNNLRLEGLMTMGPRVGAPEAVRPYFKKTKGIFERLKAAEISNIDLKYLSMGMSNSYRIAIEEGANMIRLGAAVFGKRICDLKN